MLLEVKNLKTYYQVDDIVVKALDGVSFKLQKGDNLGLVGESGCGKTTAAKSINRILPPNGGIVDGQVMFKGRDLVPLTNNQMNKVRWKEISMVTQSAMNALDPVYKIGDQITEAIHTHENMSNKAAMKRAEELFAMVGLEKKRLYDFPHQLSGGMKQRVVIAMALALSPDLIIADEPTTALDVVVQDGILKQFVDLQSQIQSSIILVTHDISVVAEICQRVAVMYAGKIMEQGTTREIFKGAYHPYTLGLLNAYPTLEAAKGNIISIPGSPPDLAKDITGCRFMERCPFRTEKCNEEPQPVEVEPDHQVLCHYPEKFKTFREETKKPSTWQNTAAAKTTTKKERTEEEIVGEKAALEIEGLKKYFPIKQSFFGGEKTILRAVDGVSFSVKEREILGLAGESGSGKSTIGELLANLQSTTSGRILYLGKETELRKKKHDKEFRRNFQVVFQDPYETLNPRFTVLNTIMEPLVIHKIGDSYEDRLERVKSALSLAELTPPENFLSRFPHQLSGGQRQRVALARAIVLEPKFIIADEPVSMLDVSIRAGVLNLLKRMRDELGASLIYISHDLATIRYICNRTAILYLGRIMEIGETEKVIAEAAHPYTQMLLAAVPIPDPDTDRERVDPRGEIPDPIDMPNGCRFHPRCPKAFARCGWEGKDLLSLLEKPGNEEVLSNFKEEVSELKIEGLDLLVKMEWKGESRWGELQKTLENFMNDYNPTMVEALNEIKVEENSLRLSFPQKEDPQIKKIDSEHEVACYLF